MSTPLFSNIELRMRQGVRAPVCSAPPARKHNCLRPSQDPGGWKCADEFRPSAIQRTTRRNGPRSPPRLTCCENETPETRLGVRLSIYMVGEIEYKPDTRGRIVLLPLTARLCPDEIGDDVRR